MCIRDRLEDGKTCSTTSKISMLQIEILLSELLQKESEISAPCKSVVGKDRPCRQPWYHAKKDHPAGAGKRCGSKRKRNSGRYLISINSRCWRTWARCSSPIWTRLRRNSQKSTSPCGRCRKEGVENRNRPFRELQKRHTDTRLHEKRSGIVRISSAASAANRKRRSMSS